MCDSILYQPQINTYVREFQYLWSNYSREKPLPARGENKNRKKHPRPKGCTRVHPFGKSASRRFSNECTWVHPFGRRWLFRLFFVVFFSFFFLFLFCFCFVLFRFLCFFCSIFLAPHRNLDRKEPQSCCSVPYRLRRLFCCFVFL